jgi:hypothetical protein
MLVYTAILFYHLVHDKEQLSQCFVHNIHWEKNDRIRKRERERKETTTQVGRMTNEPDSSLLFCSEEQSGRLSLCNYHHHHIVHARFLLTKEEDYKSLSFPLTKMYVSVPPSLCLSLIIPPTNILQLKRKKPELIDVEKGIHSMYGLEIVSFSIITHHIT